MTRAVIRKELAVLWLSPLPYVVGALFHLVLGVLYVNQLELRQQALVQPLFPVAGFLLVGMVPLLAMRSFAEEARAGSLDLLLAVPVPGRVLAVGKAMATWLTAAAVVLSSLALVALVQWWGDPDRGPVVAGYLGLLLLAAALTGIGLLGSALTESQPVAAMGAFFVSLLLWFSDLGEEAVDAGGLLGRMSLSERLHGFAGGVIDAGDAGFFLVLAAATVAVASFVVGRGRR